MDARELLALAPLLGMLAWAAVIDLRARRIPNWLTFSLALGGLGVSLIPSAGVVGFGGAVAGLAAGFGLTVVLFALGALGGGDVKLLAAVGAWLGPANVLWVFLAAAVVGMVIVLAQSAAQGRLRVLFRNSAVLAMGFANAEHTGVAPVAEAGRSAPRSVEKPLPYAVPVLAGTLLLLLVS